MSERQLLIPSAHCLEGEADKLIHHYAVVKHEKDKTCAFKQEMMKTCSKILLMGEEDKVRASGSS